MEKRKLEKFIEAEITEAEQLSKIGDDAGAFRRLERAHVLGQSSTYQHTRIHYLMLKHGLRQRDGREIAGQLLRIGGAATKTPLCIYPIGNTGGTNVSPFKAMAVETDLAEILAGAERG